MFKILKPLESFDWSIQTSPLSKLGGMKGVNEAHRILLETLGNKDQEKSSSRPIQNSKALFGAKTIFFNIKSKIDSESEHPFKGMLIIPSILMTLLISPIVEIFLKQLLS